MDTLEEAAQRLVADPVAAPAPVEVLRARIQQRRRRRAAARVGAVVVAVGLLVGSSTLLSDGDERTLQTVDEPDSRPGRLGELLDLLPGMPPFGDAAAEMVLVDAAAIRESWGIPAPAPATVTPEGAIEPSADEARFLDVLGRKSLWPGRVATSADVRAELGIDPGRLDRTAIWSARDEVLVPEELIIVEGVIDPAVVDRTVRSVPYWGERTLEVQDGGTRAYRWGDDPLAPDIEHKTPLRPLGLSSALAVTEGWAAYALRPTTVGAAAATRAGRSPSLAESPDLRALVGLADRHGAHGLGILPLGGMDEQGLGPIAAGTRWLMLASRTTPDGQDLTLLALIAEDATVAAAAMEALADHEPERRDDLVWVVIEGDREDVRRRFADADLAVGGFWSIAEDAD